MLVPHPIAGMLTSRRCDRKTLRSAEDSDLCKFMPLHRFAPNLEVIQRLGERMVPVRCAGVTRDTEVTTVPAEALGRTLVLLNECP